MGERAVILLSGGLDSCTCMAIAHAAGQELYPISFNYHQRHSRELDAAKSIAAHYHVAEHLIIETNMDAIGGSALTDSAIDVPQGDAERTDIPVTYVPARNLIFLSYAVGYAERVGATHVYIGVNSVDYSGYPDCRPAFITAFQRAADAATAASASAQPRANSSESFGGVGGVMRKALSAPRKAARQAASWPTASGAATTSAPSCASARACGAAGLRVSARTRYCPLRSRVAATLRPCLLVAPAMAMRGCMGLSAF